MRLKAQCIEPDGRLLIEQGGQRILIPTYEIDDFIEKLKKHCHSEALEFGEHFEMYFKD